MDGERFGHGASPLPLRDSVIVDNFDIVSIRVDPAKANPVLIVHTNAVLALSVFAQGFQAVAGGDRKVIQFEGRVQDRKLLPCAATQGSWNSPAFSGFPQQLSVGIAKAQDHL